MNVQSTEDLPFPPENKQLPLFLPSRRPLWPLNHVFQPHFFPKVAFMILPNCSNSPCGFSLPGALKIGSQSAPATTRPTSPEAEPASAPACRRSQVTGQLTALWWLHTEMGMFF